MVINTKAPYKRSIVMENVAAAQVAFDRYDFVSIDIDSTFVPAWRTSSYR
jgi:hypothetical protein